MPQPSVEAWVDENRYQDEYSTHSDSILTGTEYYYCRV